MNIKQYNVSYLEDVKDTVGEMLEYAVRAGYNPLVIWDKFVISKIAIEIEKGNPRYLAGYSSFDFLNIIINTLPVYKNDKIDLDILENNDEKINEMYYWGASSIVQLQYETGLSFKDINKYCSLSEVLALYDTLHEADISKFIDIAKSKIKKEKPDTNLKILRKASGLSQKELAEKANVELRSIQMYEQRRNDINKAQVSTLYRLAKILSCNIEDLMEILE